MIHWEEGGCIHINNTSLKATNCKFIDNFSNNGSAIYAENSSIKLKSCEFIKNNAMKNGGAINISNCDLISLKSKFNDNIANGAAVIDAHNSILRICSCEFNNNSALNNGGVINHSCSFVKFDDCSFKNNKAEYSSVAHDGYYSSDNIIFKNSEFVNNQSYENLILMDCESSEESSKLFLRECIFENNVSCSAELIKSSKLYLSSTDFKNNKSGDELIKVKELFIGENDLHFKDMINANNVIENIDIDIKEKEIAGEINKKDWEGESPRIFYELFRF